MSEKKKKGKRLYEIRSLAVEPKSEKSSPLDEALREEDEGLAREAKRLRLETVVARRKKELRKLEEESPESGSEVNPGTELIKYMISQGTTAEKANEFIKGLDAEAITKLQLLHSNPKGQNALLPFLLIAKRPEVSAMDLIDLQSKYFDSALDLVKEKSKPKEEGGLRGDAVNLMREMLTEIREERKARMEDKISALAKKVEESRFDPRSYIDSLSEQAEKLGLRRGEPGKVTEQDLRLEEMRETHELKLTELNLNLQKWMHERDAESRKWDMISSFVGPGIAAAAPGMREGFRKLGRGPEGFRPRRQREPPPVSKGVIELACLNCAKLVTIREPYPDEVVCRQCNTRYRHVGRDEKGEIYEQVPEGKRQAKRSS